MCALDRRRTAAVAVVGLALALGGGYGVAAGVAGLGQCGSTTLVAGDVADPPADYTAFENLTDRQQALARQAVEGDSPRVTGEEWPWSESALTLRYRGDYYELYTVTSPCPFPPAALLGVGGLGLLGGLVALAVVGRQVRGETHERPQ